MSGKINVQLEVVLGEFLNFPINLSDFKDNGSNFVKVGYESDSIISFCVWIEWLEGRFESCKVHYFITLCHL